MLSLRQVYDFNSIIFLENFNEDDGLYYIADDYNVKHMELYIGVVFQNVSFISSVEQLSEQGVENC